MIRRYPQNKAELAALRSVYRHGSRSTENAALCSLPPDKQRELDAVEIAIEMTKDRHKNAPERLKVIKSMYWGRDRGNVVKASLAVPCSENSVKRWNADFVQRVDTAYETLGRK